MPSAAKKLVVVQNNEPAPEPSARADELRLLEALLFASREPIDEATLSRHLPNGVNLKDALARLKAEYAPRGVNLVRVGKKWTFRTSDDLSWLLTKQRLALRRSMHRSNSSRRVPRIAPLSGLWRASVASRRSPP